MVTMETKSAISWVLVPNVSIPNFIHLYTSITELWAIMLLHHFWKRMPNTKGRLVKKSES